jgi:hypothetical protein
MYISYNGFSSYKYELCAVLLLLISSGLEGIFFVDLAFSASITATFIILMITQKDNFCHILWGVGFSVFFTWPFLIGFITEDIQTCYLYNQLTILTLIYFRLTKNVYFKFPKQLSIVNYRQYYLILILSAIGVAVTNGDGFIFFGSLSILYLLRNLKTGGWHDVKKLLVPYFIFYFFYSNFYWSGFGRLILAGFVLVPLLSFVVVGGYRVKNYYIYFGAILVSILMTALRFKDGVSLDNIKNDSAIGPFFLAQSIYESRYIFDFDFFGFLNQFSLVFLAFIPRFLWQDKPIGFGRLYVNQQMDTSIYSDEHSIAGLYNGEIIYFTGEYWFLFSLFAIFFMSSTFKVLNKLNKNHDNYSFIAALFVPTFLWGGFASFGARFSTVFIFILFWMSIEMILKKSSRLT